MTRKKCSSFERNLVKYFDVSQNYIYCITNPFKYLDVPKKKKKIRAEIRTVFRFVLVNYICILYYLRVLPNTTLTTSLSHYTGLILLTATIHIYALIFSEISISRARD